MLYYKYKITKYFAYCLKLRKEEFLDYFKGKKIMKKIILCLICLLVCSCSNGETQNNNSYVLNLEHYKFPSGIYFDGHIYWCTSTETSESKEEPIGELKTTMKENHFPVSDFVGTSDLKDYIGSKIIVENNKLYLSSSDEIMIFEYINEPMDKVKSIKETPKHFSDSDYAVPPHFVFNDMIYYLCQSVEIDYPNYFNEVGKIRETFFIANENYTGALPVGSILYSTDFQNRFMIVKNSEDNLYYLFDNGAYDPLISK